MTGTAAPLALGELDGGGRRILRDARGRDAGRPCDPADGRRSCARSSAELAEPPQPGAALARSFRRADAQPLIPGEPAELVFDLEPTSYLFGAGHRVRLSLAGAERDHFARVPAAGEVRLRFHRDRLRPSRLELPIALPER